MNIVNGVDVKSYIGKKINKLTVLDHFSVHRDKGGGYIHYFKVKCDCGRIFNTNAGFLIKGKTKSCGACDEFLMVGKKFNKLTVLKFVGRNSSGTALFKCRCDCGNESVVTGTSLKSGTTKSCGECSKRTEIGKVYSGITVLEYVGYNSKAEYSLYKCRCSCGNEFISRIDRFRQGCRFSCGKCFHKLPDSYKPDIHKVCQILAQRYSSIYARCTYLTNNQFYNYGGRGIRVTMSKIEFIKYYYKMNIDFENLQVDRIDNDKNYSFDNIRWVTPQENANNRINNIVDVNNPDYDLIAKRQLSYRSISNMVGEDKIKDYYYVDLGQTNSDGNKIFVFIHYTLRDKLMYYINRIIGFYKEFGSNITYLGVYKKYNSDTDSKYLEFGTFSNKIPDVKVEWIY